MYHKLFSAVLILSVTLCLCNGTSLYPKSLVTQKGSVSTIPLSALDVKDQSGSQDTWNNYVEFYGTSSIFQGIFSFDASAVASVTSYTLNVNFKGPAHSDQVWQFEWLIPSTNTWVFAGDNTAASSWKWSSLSFGGTSAFSSLESSGIVQLRFSSKTSSDNCDVDFLELVTTSSASTIAPTAVPTKPAAAPSAAPAATAAPTAKPTAAPTAAPTAKPTTAPSVAPSAAPPAPTNGKMCAAGKHYAPGPYTTWQWQLSGTVDTSIDVQVYDIDMYGASTSLIASLHSQGRAVVCYIDTAYEPGRPDSSQFTAAVLGNGISGWPGQKWVDIRSSVVRNIMTNRLALAASKNCDAVEMDDVDSYLNNPGFPLTYADQLDFNKFLATEAHKLDLGIALKNDLDQVADLVSSFDFAINEQCFEYSECSSLSSFISQGKAVFGVEYNLATSQFCSQANTDKFSFLKKDLNLDATRTQCCAANCGGTYTCAASASSRSIQGEEEAIIVLDQVAEEIAQFEDSKFENSGSKLNTFACAVVIALVVTLL